MKYQADSGAWLSIVTYLFLSILKVSMGSIMMSKALSADGWNNVTDVLASGAVLIGLKISRKPRDEDHPYGHSRAESVSALIASFIMATIALEVLKDGIETAWVGKAPPPAPLTFWVALGSAGLMLLVSAYNRRLARRTKSRAIEAVSKDNLSDALVSVGAAAGILGAQWGFPWLDPAAAIMVGLIILKTAWGIFREMSHHLTDGFHEKKLDQYRKTMEKMDGVRSVVDLKGRMHGNHIILDAVIEVDAGLNVEESHRITEELEREMSRTHQVEETLIHVEPR
ncbi:cation diffusion facilitator family transporter [Melghirimyces profundicolus]|uniref:Cation diffusion facilitator family transporter n=1 Tax=Melghirimyces profundicolus TaxID=1242148 RepID=A0A2T6B015_9BACL|nr:cation diffusion facilitator family transporter [Melghirimyces profundicolus]PTX49343.1 cation diffusion facilitator family transporter [Melghirimyces profundicolus]